MANPNPKDPLIGLGIDAGGTFTDVVLVSISDASILCSAKARTTPESPAKGIQSALQKLPPNLVKKAGCVSLATTFATNAIVQGKGSRAGLILIGYNWGHPDLRKISPKIFVRGGHDYWGNEVAPLELSRLESQLKAFLKDIDAIAVSGYFSIRNPDHELQVLQFLRQHCDLPVVAGHQLSAKLDAPKRATTAWWNARLIPLVNQLIKDTEGVLEDFHIKAPLLIVKGDGTLMSVQEARHRPVETILSGPAASIIGARFLTGQKDGLVVDMGGTTTDMAVLRGGRVETDPNGATVGGWNTQVEAARIRTTGLGGDSLIWSTDGRITSIKIGPQRVEPLCTAAMKFPEILTSLDKLLESSETIPLSLYNPCSFYVAGKVNLPFLSKIPTRLLRGPVNEYQLLSKPEENIDKFLVKQLELTGVLKRISLTPTDFCVAAGTYQLGSREAARAGVHLFAKALGVKEVKLRHALVQEFSRRLCMEAVRLCLPAEATALMTLMPHWFTSAKSSPDSEQPMKIALTLAFPVLAIGAPAQAWLSEAFKPLRTYCVVPEHHMVGTAVGAAMGTVGFTLNAEVRPTPQGNFILFTPEAKTELKDFDTAVAEGKELLENLARARMAANGIKDPVLNFEVQDHSVPIPGGKLHLYTSLTVHATGRVPVSETLS